jgi:hypothetical protein
MATLKQEFIFFNDEDGRIRPNAKMKFFEAGTTTPKATYTTVDLTSPNPWPVVASGDGIFPPIFLETGGYKVEVYDQDDVLIRTRDNLNIAETTVLSTSNFYFSTLVDAKLGVSINGSPINLQVGQVARTAGKNTVDDGEGAEWLVVAAGTGTADDDLYADIDNGLQLQRLFNQLYAKNDLSDVASTSQSRANLDVFSKAESFKQSSTNDVFTGSSSSVDLSALPGGFPGDGFYIIEHEAGSSIPASSTMIYIDEAVDSSFTGYCVSGGPGSFGARVSYSSSGTAVTVTQVQLSGLGNSTINISRIAKIGGQS